MFESIFQKTRFLTYVVLILAFMLSACGGQSASGPVIAVEDAWARPAGGMAMGHGDSSQEETQSGTEDMDTMGGVNGAVYMTLRNTGSQPDRLTSVESEAAEAGEIHQTEIQNDVMTMRPVDSVEVPANGQVTFEPGGLHIMLIGLRQAFQEGETISLRLNFETSGEMVVEAEVRAP